MNKEIKVYFLILNYNTAEETLQCIKTINELEDKSEDVKFRKKIIIIDNHSNDDSIGKFREAGIVDCSEISNTDTPREIELYEMPNNIGFSKANNYGYHLIKKRKDADYIVVCNSDIEFRQKDFLFLLNEEHTAYMFDICGPDVYCPTFSKGKRHQSPLWPWEHTYWYVRMHYIHHRNLSSEKPNPMVRFFTSVLFRSIDMLQAIFFRRFRLRRRCKIELYGACIIVASNFIANEEKLFFPETNFYYEELLLWLRVKDKSYKTVYQPSMQVFHMQGTATSKITSEKFKFVHKNLSDSAQIYLNELGKRKRLK